jgi:hypothetical protein
MSVILDLVLALILRLTLNRQRAVAQRKACEEDLKVLSQKNAELIVSAERAMREGQSCREQLDRMTKIR